MARVSTIITNFRAGELSPKLHGRVDLQKYQEGVDTLENMIVYPSGGITRRPGTTYIGKTRRTFATNPLWDSSSFNYSYSKRISYAAEARLINFEFSDEESYVLEFAAGYIQFYKDQTLVVKPETKRTMQGASPSNYRMAVQPGPYNQNILDNFGVGVPVQFSGIVDLSVSGVTGKLVRFNEEILVISTSPYPSNSVNQFSISIDNDLNAAGSLNNGSHPNANLENNASVTVVTSVTTTYTTDQLAEINFTQSADVMYIVHKDHPPRKLTRTTATNFTLTDIDFVDGPYLDENITDTTMQVNAATGAGVTVTASADTFSAVDVGRLIRFREIIELEQDEWKTNTAYAQGARVRFADNVYLKTNSGTHTSATTPPAHTDGTRTYGPVDWRYEHSGSGYVKITAFTSATVVTATVQETAKGGITLPNSCVASTSKLWSLGAFGGDQKYPRAVAFYEERLYFAGTVGKPQSVFGSVTADFENHTPGLNDDNAINITIASDRVNVIKHLLPARFLQILTTSAEFTLSGGTGTQPVTPTNVNVLRETTFGASQIRPLRAGNSTILVQKGGEKVKEITFDLDTDGLLGVDLTVLADHLTKGGIKDMVWQQEPQLILWFVTNIGELLGLTYDRSNGTVGWHRHTTGGKFGIASIQGINIPPNNDIFEAGDTVTITKSDGTKVTFTGVPSTVTAGEFEFTIGVTNVQSGYFAKSLTSLKAKVDAQPGLEANLGPEHTAGIVEHIKTIVFNETTSTGGYTKVSVNKRLEPFVITTSEGPPIIESVTSIPSGNEDQVYIIVKRTVSSENLSEFNKRTERHIEVLNKLEFDNIEDAVYVDSSVTYDGLPTTNIKGLHHLENKKVQILADGSAHADKTVVNAEVFLDRSASKVHVGYGYDSNVKTLRLEAGSNDGISQGEIKRIHGITVRFLDTVGALVGPDENNLDQLPFRDSSMAQDEAVPLFTGDKEISFPSGYENNAQVFIKQNQALPMTVVAIMRRSNTFDA